MRYIHNARLIVTIMFITIMLCDCKKEIKLSSENTINLFYLRKINNQGLSEEVSFTVDEQKGEITGSILKWIDSQTPSKLIAGFEKVDASSVTVNGINQASNFTVNDFKETLNYTVKAENGNEKTYKVRVICPQINVSLPVIRINANDPIFSGDLYTKANLQLIGNGITEGIWNSYADGKTIDIRLRGHSTMWLPKQPYRINSQRSSALWVSIMPKRKAGYYLPTMQIKHSSEMR